MGNTGDAPRQIGGSRDIKYWGRTPVNTIGGGKFGNGALTGAFGYMLNTGDVLN